MNLDRRAFLGVAAGLTAAAALPGCASVAALPVVPRDGAVRLPLAEHPQLRAPGGHLRLRLPERGAEIYVLGLPDGEFAALSPICTHLGCTVDIQGVRLVCPCHGSTYDRTGLVLQGPAERPLARYATRLTSDGVLTIDLRSRT